MLQNAIHLGSSKVRRATYGSTGPSSNGNGNGNGTCSNFERCHIMEQYGGAQHLQSRAGSEVAEATRNQDSHSLLVSRWKCITKQLQLRRDNRGRKVSQGQGRREEGGGGLPREVRTYSAGVRDVLYISHLDQLSQLLDDIGLRTTC